MKEVVSVAVFNEDGDLLCGLRKDTWRWNLPGGSMKPGETPEQAAVRELFEETGIKVPQKDLVRLGSEKVKTFKGVEATIHSFEVRVANSKKYTTKHDPDEECVCWKWVSCDADGLPDPYRSRWHNKHDVTLNLLGLEHEPLKKAEPMFEPPELDYDNAPIVDLNVDPYEFWVPHGRRK